VSSGAFDDAWGVVKDVGDPGDVLHWDPRFGGTPYPAGRQIFDWAESDAAKRPIAQFGREHNVSYPLEGLDELLPDFKDISRGKSLRSEGHSILGSPFGSTSKMPGGSMGFPTHTCVVGGKLRKVPGSTCENCYAHGQFRYALNNKNIAHWRNAAALRMPDEEGTIEYASALANRIPASVFDYGDPRFRLFDSGDLQGKTIDDRAKHLSVIADAMKHIESRSPVAAEAWMPTREEGAVGRFMSARDWDTAIPENLKISLSAPFVGQGLDDDENVERDLPKLSRRFHELTSHPQIAPSFTGASGEGIHVCPTSQSGGSCMDMGCDACWGGGAVSFNISQMGHKNRPVRMLSGNTLGYDEGKLPQVISRPPFNLNVKKPR